MKVALSNLDKPFYPADGLTKGDVVEYYRRIAPVMLPHMQDRPLMLHRLPNGIDGYAFYQKGVPDYFPEWIPRVTVAKEGGRVTHPLCNDVDTLVYLTNQGTLTNHVWLSRADDVHRPDRLVFDLDPPEGGYAVARRAARELKALLEDLGLVPFLTTTGSKGYHVVVPLVRGPVFEVTRSFGMTVAELLARRHPDVYTTEHRKANRHGRLFLDFTRNAYAQTVVAPYSLRSRPGAPVATPLDWSELGRTEPQRFHLRNVFWRLARKEDPWRGIEAHARPLEPAWSAIQPLVGRHSAPPGPGRRERMGTRRMVRPALE